VRRPGSLPPVLYGLARAKGRDRRAWWFVFGAMASFNVQNVIWYVNVAIAHLSNAHTAFGIACGVLGTIFMLSAAISVVLRRGRNDVGGVIDATVVCSAPWPGCYRPPRSSSRRCGCCALPSGWDWWPTPGRRRLTPAMPDRRPTPAMPDRRPTPATPDRRPTPAMPDRRPTPAMPGGRLG
jgi:hypothetical protein